MSGESDLVLGSLTVDELDEANRFVTMLAASWATQAKTGTAGFRSDGPFHAITALRLSVIAEMAQRGGAEPWYPGAPTDGHVARRVLDLYARRYQLRAQEATPTTAGLLERTCVICGQRKAQTDEHFDRPDGLWSDICRSCRVTDWNRAVALQDEYGRPQAASTAPPPPTDAQLAEML